jgi:Cu+-exporting ATPase
VQPAAGFNETEVLTLAAAVESASEHPLARAIVEAARTRGLTLPAAENFLAEPGTGVTARVDGRQISVGRNIPAAPENLAFAQNPAATLVGVTIDGRFAGTVALADPIKATTPEAIA